jgi:nitrate reductase gamma subunit
MSMNVFYQFITGPLAWAALLLFVGGLVGRLLWLLWLVRKRDPFVKEYMSLKYGLRSIIMWSIPFVAVNWRLRPVFTVVTFVFHICLLLSPIFLLAHNLMVEETWGWSLPTLPTALADVMSWIVVACCIYFIVRRFVLPPARYVTRYRDILLVALVAAPYLTGSLAYHQIIHYKTMISLHIVLGELLLAVIPFTWLSHLMLGPLIRAYMGSEFGDQRNVPDW